jgi:hypothetical protein
VTLIPVLPGLVNARGEARKRTAERARGVRCGESGEGRSSGGRSRWKKVRGRAISPFVQRPLVQLAWLFWAGYRYTKSEIAPGAPAERACGVVARGAG